MTPGRNGRSQLQRSLLALAIGLPVVALMGLLGWGLSQTQYRSGGVAVFERLGEVPVEEKAPRDFILPRLAGGTFQFSELRGQVVLVDFWASWCPPCRREAPLLQRIWAAYESQGVAFVGVAIWDSAEEVQKFVERYNITYPQVLDEKGTVAVEFGITGVPEKFFFDRQGILRRKFVGPMNEVILRQTLDSLLGRSP